MKNVFYNQFAIIENQSVIVAVNWKQLCAHGLELVVQAASCDMSISELTGLDPLDKSLIPKRTEIEE